MLPQALENWQRQLKEQLLQLKRLSHYRSLKPQPEGIDFLSNDYLGLSHDAEFQALLKQNIQDFQQAINGATGSRLLSGEQEIHRKTEELLARWWKAENVLLFPSGYQANVGLLQSLAGKNDLYLLDEKCHASLKDGVRLSLAKHFSFAHNDVEALRQKLSLLRERFPKGNIFVVCEALYSMDGTYAPIPEILKQCQEYNALLVVDEAHTTAWYGKDGAGLVADLGLEAQVAARIMTFGKAMGSQGAAIAGSQTLREYLINNSRAFIYSTGISPLLCLSLSAAYYYLERKPAIRNSLKENIRLFGEAYGKVFSPNEIDLISERPKKQIGISASPIQTIKFSGNEAVVGLAETLQKQGFSLKPVRSPTVPKGEERIRICLHSFDNAANYITLLQALKNYAEEKGIGLPNLRN